MNGWNYPMLIIGMLLAMKMLLAGIAVPAPFANGRIWFLVLIVTMAVTMWASVKDHFSVLITLTVIVLAWAVLSPTPLVWPFAAAMTALAMTTWMQRVAQAS